jgi:FolB domain-containing protein
MDRIIIRNIHVHGILGVNDWERTNSREIIITVTLFTDTRLCGNSDNIDNCVDYSQVTKEIRALVEKARRFTVEALAEDIARVCLSRENIQKVIVKVEKPGALLDVETVGVEIERTN